MANVDLLLKRLDRTKVRIDSVTLDILLEDFQINLESDTPSHLEKLPLSSVPYSYSPKYGLFINREEPEEVKPYLLLYLVSKVIFHTLIGKRVESFNWELELCYWRLTLHLVQHFDLGLNNAYVWSIVYLQRYIIKQGSKDRDKSGLSTIKEPFIIESRYPSRGSFQSSFYLKIPII